MQDDDFKEKAFSAVLEAKMFANQGITMQALIDSSQTDRLKTHTSNGRDNSFCQGG